jgi:hypothetical protein
VVVVAGGDEVAADSGGGEVVRKAGGVGLLSADDQRQALVLGEGRQRYHAVRGL